ncbi:helix-turn-helix domain-containing protein [Streptomyces sp. NPDC002742]|uniref:helix-turn-helix domain-containing protein n=1 Tax=Streptomyces sp. NPDC002742 TaxID=3364663 RepID=UPI0036CFCB38
MTTSMKPLSDDLPEGKKNLANAVRKELAESGKTLRQVANEAHVSPAALSLIASGRRKPSDTTLDNILRATTAHSIRRTPRCKAELPKRSYLTDSWRALLKGAALIIMAVMTGVVAYLHMPGPRAENHCGTAVCENQIKGRNYYPGNSPDPGTEGDYCDDGCYETGGNMPEDVGGKPGTSSPPPSPSPSPSPGLAPWPEGQPRTSGFLALGGGAVELFLHRNDREPSTSEEDLVKKVGVECWSVGPDQKQRYLVRMEDGDTRFRGKWFWVDRENVGLEPEPGERQKAPACQLKWHTFR